MRLAACVPAYRNAATVGQSVASLLAQSVPPDDVFVVDDGSDDETAEVARRAGARVVSLGSNQGRGAARARCVDEAGDADVLVSVDGTAVLAPDFTERALRWLEQPRMAAVYGKIEQLAERTVADRWRGRHLYRLGMPHVAGTASSFISWGYALRLEAAREVGNFSLTHRHSEDLEFGARLLAAGWGITYEPSARVVTLVSNTVEQVLERWWRWNGLLEREEVVSVSERKKLLAVLMRADVAARDLASLLVSWKAVSRIPFDRQTNRNLPAASLGHPVPIRKSPDDARRGGL